MSKNTMNFKEGKIVKVSDFYKEDTVSVAPSNPCIITSTKIKIYFSCYQDVQMNSYQRRNLCFYQIHHLQKTFLYQIQYHIII